MLLFKRIKPLNKYLSSKKGENTMIGFVPTMGALHDGHLSLIEQAKKDHTLVVCSIFVNPTQFNEKKDLNTYPRFPHKDIDLLSKVGCDVLFMPFEDEVYPSGLNTAVNISFGRLEQVMEGAFRPGHFKGVAQVVKRLLDITMPDKLYMGQKDFQQLAVIRHMINTLQLNIDLIGCPIIREPDGLAMSSRNIRLTPQNRANATIIFQTLKQVHQWLNDKSIPEIEAIALNQLDIPSNFRSEYFKIVDGYTLEEIQEINDSEYVVACAAVWAGQVRLIDNLIIKSPTS